MTDVHGKIRFGSKSIESLSAPVAQLDRAPGFEPVGRGFESLRARHLLVRDT